MAASIYPDFPPQLTAEQSQYLISNLKDWSIANGLIVRPPPTFVTKEIDPAGVLAAPAPVTLFPSPYPLSCFEEARAIQTAYNELYATIARDEDWLGLMVAELVDVDDFIASLWEIHLNVKREGYVQELSLGLFRSDYMVHLDPSLPSAKPGIKQVEFNTIASSFGGLSSQVSLLHKHLLDISAYPPTYPPVLLVNSLPDNPSAFSLSDGLASAHTSYGRSKSSPSLPLCILFVVQSPERNVFDQRHLEYRLHSHHSIPTFRLPFLQILDQTSIFPSNPLRPLIYMPPHSPSTRYEVTTLYFRAGYSPSDYISSRSWQSRLHLERSAAIKCPSILTHLAGSKKVQQVLATPSSSHLSRFLSEPLMIKRIRSTFAAIYPLDDSSLGEQAKSIAMDKHKCRGYVLKPQREGGGNNVYRDAIPHFLRSLGGDERKWRGHILMEIIEPPGLQNTIMRNGEVESGEVISELGVYGVCLWQHGGKILQNWEAGYLLRTKGRASEEGGVAAGFGAMDSICVVDV